MELYANMYVHRENINGRKLATVGKPQKTPRRKSTLTTPEFCIGRRRQDHPPGGESFHQSVTTGSKMGGGEAGDAGGRDAGGRDAGALYIDERP